MDDLSGKEREALRNLLATIVLADGLIRDSELNEYAKKVCELTNHRTTPQDETRWLIARSKDISARMNSMTGRQFARVSENFDLF